MPKDHSIPLNTKSNIYTLSPYYCYGIFSNPTLFNHSAKVVKFLPNNKSGDFFKVFESCYEFSFLGNEELKRFSKIKWITKFHRYQKNSAKLFLECLKDIQKRPIYLAANGPITKDKHFTSHVD